MKTYLKIFAIALLATYSFSALAADDYHPLLKEGKRWVMKHNRLVCWSCEYKSDYYYYLIQGDTTINGVEYKKVMQRDYQRFGDDEYHFFLAAREENKKVYAVGLIVCEDEVETGLIDRQNDTMLYDFAYETKSGFGESKGIPYHLWTISEEEYIEFWIYTSYGGGTFTRTNQGRTYKVAYTSVAIPLSDGSTEGMTCESECWEGIGMLTEPFMVHESCGYGDQIVACYEDEELIYLSTSYTNDPTAIKNIEMDSQNETIYDIEGRRLNERPQQGLYIEGGKKRVAR